MALLDHLANMDRFLRVYSNEKPIRVSRNSAVDEVFLWYPNTVYTPANPGSADDRFISEVKRILDELWAADPQPNAPISWVASYSVGTNRMTITFTHEPVTDGVPTTCSVSQDTALPNGGRGLKFKVYAGTVKVALEYYRNHASPLLDIGLSPVRGGAISVSSASILFDPFEAMHVFSAATAQKNMSGVAIFAHELCHSFLKATMETSFRVPLAMIKDVWQGKPANQPVTNYDNTLEHDIVMNYYEIPAARAFGHGERAEYSDSMCVGSDGLLAAIYGGALFMLNQLALCKLDVVYWASDWTGATCVEMAPAPDTSMTLTAWANQIVLDWISGTLTRVWTGDAQDRGLFRNGVLIYTP